MADMPDAQEIQALKKALAQAQSELRVVRTERDLLQEQLNRFKRQLFQAKSEAASATHQKDLFFNEAEDQGAAAQPAHGVEHAPRGVVAAQAQQQLGLGLDRVQVTGDLQGLVVTAGLQALARQRHGQQQVGRVQCGFDPRHAAQQVCQGAGPAGMVAKFVARDQGAPGVAVGDRGQAGIQWRWVLQAGAAAQHPLGHRQGAGGATCLRLRKTGHAGVAYRLCRPSMANRALAGQGMHGTVDQGAEHGINILAANAFVP